MATDSQLERGASGMALHGITWQGKAGEALLVCGQRAVPKCDVSRWHGSDRTTPHGCRAALPTVTATVAGSRAEMTDLQESKKQQDKTQHVAD